MRAMDLNGGFLGSLTLGTGGWLPVSASGRHSVVPDEGDNEVQSQPNWTASSRLLKAVAGGAGPSFGRRQSSGNITRRKGAQGLLSHVGL